MGHLHGNGLLGCHVGRANRDRFVREHGRVTAHHLFPQSGWISFFINDPGDVDNALELIQAARAYGETGE